MQCPKCGFVQPRRNECIQCGIIIERYKPAAEREEALKKLAAPAPEPPGDPFHKPIRPAMKVVRTVAGLVGLLVGAWLFLAGQQLDLRPYHVLFLIGYGCVSLFWVVTSTLKVSVRQFAIEMLIFVASTLLLRLALPEAFNPGTLSNRESGPLFSSAAPRYSPDAFLKEADDLVAAAREVLDDVGDAGRSRKWMESCAGLRDRFGELPAPDRKQVESLYKKVVALEARMKKLVETPDDGTLALARSAIHEVEEALVPPAR